MLESPKLIVNFFVYTIYDNLPLPREIFRGSLNGCERHFTAWLITVCNKLKKNTFVSKKFW